MTRVLACLLASLPLLLAASTARAEEPKPAPPAPPKLEFLYLRLAGVVAEEVPAVAAALGAVPGVRTFAWFALGTEARVVREQGKASDDALVAAARAAGAETASRIPIAASSFVFDTKLHCGGCVRTVTKALTAVAGVKEVSVSEDMARVQVVYDSKATTPKALQGALAACGKPAQPTP